MNATLQQSIALLCKVFGMIFPLVSLKFKSKRKEGMGDKGKTLPHFFQSRTDHWNPAETKDS